MNLSLLHISSLAYVGWNDRTWVRLTHRIILRAVLHCNKIWTLSFQSLLFNSSISSPLTDILKSSILRSGAHVVSLIRFSTGNCDRLLKTTKRISCVEVHPVSTIPIIALLATIRPLRLSLLLLLQQTHRYWALLLLTGLGSRAHITEASTCEMTLLWPTYKLRTRPKLLVCDSKATLRANWLAILNRRQELLLLLLLMPSCRLLHVAVEARLRVVRVNWDILARITSRWDKRLIMLRLETLRELARPWWCTMTLIESSLLRAVKTVTSNVYLICWWILVHVLLETTSLRGVAIGDLRRWSSCSTRILLACILC